MPVERIYGASPPYGDAENPGEAVSIIEVRWGHHNTPVEIATKCVRRDTGEDYHRPLEPIEVAPIISESPQPENAGTMEHHFGELIELEGAAAVSGWYADFNRTALNQLIRVLRRARDAEYGKDE